MRYVTYVTMYVCMWHVRVIKRLIYMCMANNKSNNITNEIHCCSKITPAVWRFDKFEQNGNEPFSFLSLYFYNIFLFFFLNKFAAIIFCTAAFRSLGQLKCWEHYCRFSYQSPYWSSSCRPHLLPRRFFISSDCAQPWLQGGRAYRITDRYRHALNAHSMLIILMHFPCCRAWSQSTIKATTAISTYSVTSSNLTLRNAG